MSLTSISMYCELTKPRFENFQHLITLLKEKSIFFENISISARSNEGKDIEYDSVEDLKILSNDNIYDYNINIWFQNYAKINLMKSTNIHKQQFQQLTSEKIEHKMKIEEIMSVLGLNKEIDKEIKYKKNVFIAYRFDDTGQYCADQIATFLRLMGFNVLTGRSYSPQSISNKVKERMDKQDIIIVIHTNGEEITWLTQETLLGSVKKPLIILKQQDANFKPGILNDFEYIEFIDRNIQTTFIPILEGLNELNIKF